MYSTHCVTCDSSTRKQFGKKYVSASNFKSETEFRMLSILLLVVVVVQYIPQKMALGDVHHLGHQILSNKLCFFTNY